MLNLRMKLNARPILCRSLLALTLAAFLATAGTAQQMAPLRDRSSRPNLFSWTASLRRSTKGLEFERTQMWSDAIRHYETETRNYPNSTKLYQRLIISRLHHDVNRRYQDDSFVASVGHLSVSQALDLYSEILANLQTHYVESVDWSRVQIHGTAALEVALTEERFVNYLLSNADPSSD